MSLRISDHAPAGIPSLIAVSSAILLGGCGPSKPDDATVTRTETAERAAAGEILCGRGDAPLTKVCTLDRTEMPRGLVLTISYPDGGFRRLIVTRDGRGVAAADGAQAAAVAIAGDGMIDVTIGADHFRLPATIGHPAAS